MSSLDELIEIAERHVQEGRRIVARQRETIEKGKLTGTEANELLCTFERTLEIFQQDLDRLLTKKPE